MFNNDVPEEEQKKVPGAKPPVWKGIGCVMLIIIPIISYAGVIVFLQYAPRFGLSGFITTDMLADGPDPLLYVKLVGTAVLTVILYVIFIFLSVLLTQSSRGTTYGPYDIKPEVYKGKPYKR